MNQFSKFALLGLSLTLGACSVLQGDKVDYKSAGKAPSLEIPPDLTQLSRETRYAAPGAPVTASSFQLGQTSVQTTPTAVTTLGDVRIERAGTQRWLVIDRPADKLWDQVKDFWQENGFLLAMDQTNLGIMETDWAENRAKIPQDFIRNTLGKVFDSLYSTGERDKFRTRLERNANGGTDLFISHRGMIEVYSSANKDQTVWQPRAADPELEAEFLRRLMVKLGVSQEQSKVIVAAGITQRGAQISQSNGQPVVQLEEGFDRAWRRVGLSLDRTNFTVEDRDRSKGIYFVRYVASVPDKAEPGFFSNLFSSSKKDNAPQKFRISVVSQGNVTAVSVQNLDGSPAPAAEAQRIIQVLATDLK
ncbi:MAG: lipoprotein-34 [Comamonadaceae bacterium]|nr:MAG: lipoprotein-34 [Comamonadaceae bacterium]